MCKLRHKVRNGQNISRENEISSFSNLVFQINFFSFTLGFQKHIASIRLYKIHEGYMFLKTLDKKQRFYLKNLKLIAKNRLAIRFTWQNEP